MQARSLPELDTQHTVLQKRTQHLASWTSILLFLCITITVVAGQDWLHTGGHWYQSSIHAARLFLVLGVYALARSQFARKLPCVTLNACVIPLSLIAFSIMLENPEVKVHYDATLGGAHQTVQQVFRWLEHALPAAEFDSVLAAASNTTSSTSIAGTPLFLVGCVAQELRHGALSVIDTRCHQHEAFPFNVIVGHAFLLSIAAHSGLTCRCCMASWLLSQLSSMILLFVHDAPSLSVYLYSVAPSFFLCLSLSFWAERDTKIGRVFCTCFPLQSYSLPACMSQSLISSDTLVGTPVSNTDSEGSESTGCMGEDIRIVLEDGTLEPMSNLRRGQKILAIDGQLGQVVSTELEQIKKSNPKSVALVKIEFSSGDQATCPSGHMELTKDDGVTYKEVPAGNLLIGARVLVFHVVEEMVAAVTVQPASDETTPLGFESQSGLPLAANPLSDMNIAMSSRAKGAVDCWGPRAPETETSQVTPALDKFSSSLASEASSAGAVDFKVGPRLVRELALSQIAKIPQGMDGQFYSCGSLHHPHNCTPCWFHSRKKGCADGVLCGQCHYPHPDMKTTYKKRRAGKKRQEVQQPQQTNPGMSAIVQTVKNSFVEWVLSEENELSPCMMRRAHSAPEL